MLLKLLIDSYVVAIGCSIFLPIGAFRFTSHVIAHYVGAVLSVGLQLFFSLVILGIAQTLASGWIFELTANAGFITSNIEIPLQIAAEAFVFLVLLWTIPAYIGRLVVGAVIPGIGAVRSGTPDGCCPGRRGERCGCGRIRSWSGGEWHQQRG